MSLYKQNNKIVRSGSGELLVNSGGNTSKLSHIDANLQVPNMVFKDSNNRISQVTDKKNKDAYSQHTASKQPTFNYDGRIGYASGTKQYLISNNKGAVLPSSSDFTIKIKVHAPSVSNQFTNAIYQNMDEDQIGSGSPKNVNFMIRMDTDILPTYKVFQFLYTTDGTWATGNVREGGTNHALPADDIYNTLIIRRSNWLYIVTNGVLGLKVIMTDSIANLSVDKILGNASYSTPVDYSLLAFEVYDSALYDFSAFSPSSNVILPNFDIKPFFYYKRFKPDSNRLIYTNSRFLEDCDINTSDEITSLKSEVNDFELKTKSVGQEPKLTKYGIDFGGSLPKRLFAFNGGSESLKTDFNENTKIYAECWFYPRTTAVDQWFYNISTSTTGFYLNFLYNSLGVGNIRIFFNGSSLGVIGTAALDKWTHVAALYDKTNMYTYVNGVCTSITPIFISDNSTNIFKNVGAFDNTSTGAFDGILDEMPLILDEMPFDPVGSIVGRKKIEPLRRRSLNNQLTVF